FVLGALAECPLLPAEELRRARSMWPFEIAGPEIVRLHHVKVAVEDQIAVACHVAPPIRQQATTSRFSSHSASLPRPRIYVAGVQLSSLDKSRHPVNTPHHL